MRNLNLQNTILVSLLVAGAATIAACSSSDATRPDGGAGSTSGGTGSTAGGSTATGGTGDTTTGGSTAAAGSSSVAGTTSTAGAGGGTSAPSVCDGTASRVLTTSAADAFISDFEAATDNPTTMMADATQAPAAWYAFNDVMPTTNAIHILRAPGGAAGTGFFGHYAGTGAITPVKGGFGVGVEVNVGVNMGISQYCVDASVFQGISFWAKAASSANATITAGFVVPSANQVTNGGDCPDTTPALTAKCNNYPQKSITLTTEWTQYTVDWATLKSTTGQTVVGGKIQQSLWLAPTTDWDFSLDEVAFYTGTPPAGAVAAPVDSGTGGTGAGGSAP